MVAVSFMLQRILVKQHPTLIAAKYLSRIKRFHAAAWTGKCLKHKHRANTVGEENIAGRLLLIVMGVFHS